MLKLSIRSILLILVLTLVTYPVFGQNIENSFDDEFLKLDDSLTPTTTATLTGLSLTGASLLVAMTRNTDDKLIENIRMARKSFIKAFYMFLLCTVALLLFDFIQVLDNRDIVLTIILDVVISYVLFGIGIFYLINAARRLYRTYGK